MAGLEEPVTDLPPTAQKVQQAVLALGLDGAVREMSASTRTAEEAAAACGVAVGQIVKSLIFVGAKSGQPYLFLVSGSNRVDEQGVTAFLGESLTRPKAEQVKALTGFAIGGVPPLGHETRIATYMDRDLLQYSVVWAAAGTPRAVFPADPHALCRAVGALVIAVN
jgi:prolyl-tRNA editing enzyme YbaK/EbsC (Cys-tRNA(Pro) deacylase)